MQEAVTGGTPGGLQHGLPPLQPFLCCSRQLFWSQRRKAGLHRGRRSILHLMSTVIVLLGFFRLIKHKKTHRFPLSTLWPGGHLPPTPLSPVATGEGREAELLTTTDCLHLTQEGVPSVHAFGQSPSTPLLSSPLPQPLTSIPIGPQAYFRCSPSPLCLRVT